MEFHDIPYKVSYRDIKYPRLEFKTGKLLVVVPFGYNYEEFLKKHKNWIIKNFKFITESLEKTKYKKLVLRAERDFRKLIQYYAKEVSRELKVEFNHIYFRKMRTKWASLSSSKNLTINKLMKHLPEYLIRYIVYHELSHIIERKHNSKFWKIISEKYKDYKKMENEMFIYWFLVFNNNTIIKKRRIL